MTEPTEFGSDRESYPAEELTSLARKLDRFGEGLGEPERSFLACVLQVAQTRVHEEEPAVEPEVAGFAWTLEGATISSIEFHASGGGTRSLSGALSAGLRVSHPDFAWLPTYNPIGP